MSLLSSGAMVHHVLTHSQVAPFIVPMKYTHTTLKKVGLFYVLEFSNYYESCTYFTFSGEWSEQEVRLGIPIPEWDSFTLTKIDDEHALAIAGVQQGPGAVNDVYCLQMEDSPTTGDPEWVYQIS